MLSVHTQPLACKRAIGRILKGSIRTATTKCPLVTRSMKLNASKWALPNVPSIEPASKLRMVGKRQYITVLLALHMPSLTATLYRCATMWALHHLASAIVAVRPNNLRSKSSRTSCAKYGTARLSSRKWMSRIQKAFPLDQTLSSVTIWGSLQRSRTCAKHGRGAKRAEREHRDNQGPTYRPTCSGGTYWPDAGRVWAISAA